MSREKEKANGYIVSAISKEGKKANGYIVSVVSREERKGRWLHCICGKQGERNADAQLSSSFIQDCSQ